MTHHQPTDPLPEFEHPPVTEVALTIQLEEAIGFRALDLASIAACWTDALPNVEERPRLPRLDADLEDTEAILNLIRDSETPRLWLQNDAGNQVLQLQQDRIAVNWSKATPTDDYPHYAQLRTFLVDVWQKLTRRLSEIKIAVPTPIMCQVIYVNELGSDQGWYSVSDTSRFLSPWSGTMSTPFLPDDYRESLTLHFHLPEERGWMNISNRTIDMMDDGISQTDEKALVLTLESGGWPDPPTFSGALDFMDLAHEWIVRGFTAVTTAEAHKQWRRLV